MTTSISMAYGSRKIAFKNTGPSDVFTIREPDNQVDADRFLSRLEDCLYDFNLDLSHPAVVLADKTRLCGYPQYLPVLLDALVAHGAPAARIRIYIAYGTHPAQTDEESFATYGAVYGRFQWVHHRCEGEDFIEMGKTSKGTPIRLRRDIAEASCVITFGAVSHHYFAGYGGGRKLMFPGLGQKAAIYANHGLFLDRGAGRLASGCRPGQLNGNPLAMDLAEYESHRPADMAIHGLLNSRGQVYDLLVGRGSAHFQSACTRHAAHCEAAADRQYDLVVASCGGFPKDINFIQSHKAIHHAADFVCDGGQLIVLAECRDGIGSRTFLSWFEMGGAEAAFEALSNGYVGNGGTALAMMSKLDRIRIGLVTQLDIQLAVTIGFEWVTPDQIQALLDHHQGSLAFIPNAGMLVKKPGRPSIEIK